MTDSQPPVRLRENAFWAAVGAIAQMSSQFGMILVFDHFGSARVVGLYALGLAIATPLSVFADRALRTIQATGDHGDMSIGDYLSFRFAVSCAALAMTVLIIAGSGFSILSCQIILLVTLSRTVEGIAQVLYGLMQQREQMRTIACSQVLRATVGLAGVVLVMAELGRLDVALVIGICSQLIVVCVFDLPRIKRLEGGRVLINMEGVPWKRMLALSLPLATATLLVSLNTNMPRYIVSAYFDEQTLGIFSVLCYLCLPAMMVVSSCLQAATPRLARLHRSGSRRVSTRILMRLVGVSAAVAVVNGTLIWSGGRRFLEHVFGADYVAAASTLPWIAVAAGVSYLAAVPATLLTVQRRFVAGVYTCLSSTGICLIAGLILIPSYRLHGAAWSMLLSASVHGLVASVFLIGNKGRIPGKLEIPATNRRQILHPGMRTHR